MTLIIKELHDVDPERLRGDKATAEIYVKDGDQLTKMPPIWTLRGYIERGDFPIHRDTYDRGLFAYPVNREQHQLFLAEIARLYKPFSHGIMGRRLLINDVLFIVFVTVAPERRGQGLFSQWLDNLPVHQTIIFPEVLPDTVVPAALQARGFAEVYVADTDDDLNIFYPCYVRQAK